VLHYPSAYPNMTKEKCQELEDALTEKFIREMRKPPVAKTQDEE